jgi:hypothetical protein
LSSSESGISIKYNSTFVEESDLTFLADIGLSKEDLQKIIISESLDSTGKQTYSWEIEWEALVDSFNKPQNFLDALASSEPVERMVNAFQGFGYVTNQQILETFYETENQLKNFSKTGTVISVRGRGPVSSAIKIGSGGTWNHTAILYEDDNNKKWVFEMPGPNPGAGLQIKELEEWLQPYRNKIEQISISNTENQQDISGALKNSIERNLFYWEQDENGKMVRTDEVVEIKYDTLNVVGLHWEGFICSALIVDLYDKADIPLFGLDDGDKQLQYSPSDVYERLKLLGYID